MTNRARQSATNLEHVIRLRTLQKRHPRHGNRCPAQPLDRVGEAVDRVVEIGEHAGGGAVDDRAQQLLFGAHVV